MTTATSHSFSLSAIRRGDRVVIRRILFEELRMHCAQLELGEGDVVCCHAAGAHLMLETPEGRLVALERDRARFVEVSQASVERRKRPAD